MPWIPPTLISAVPSSIASSGLQISIFRRLHVAQHGKDNSIFSIPGERTGDTRTGRILRSRFILRQDDAFALGLQRPRL